VTKRQAIPGHDDLPVSPGIDASNACEHCSMSDLE
jgi:hypothetical protein